MVIIHTFFVFVWPLPISTTKWILIIPFASIKWHQKEPLGCYILTLPN